MQLLYVPFSPGCNCLSAVYPSLRTLSHHITLIEVLASPHGTFRAPKSLAAVDTQPDTAASRELAKLPSPPSANA